MLNKFYNFCNHQKFEFTSLRNECISNIPKLSVATTNKKKTTLPLIYLRLGKMQLDYEECFGLQMK